MRNKWRVTKFQKGRSRPQQQSPVWLLSPSSAQKKKKGVTVVQQSLPFIHPLLWPALLSGPCLTTSWLFHSFFSPCILWLIRTSAGRDLSQKPCLQCSKKKDDFCTTTKQGVHKIYYNKEQKLENLAACQNHFLSVSITEAFHLLLLPFSSYVKAVFKCFHITSSFHYGKPRHSSSGISLFLVCTLSTPVHPGIETAWAGMENPTSVQTEAHCSLALQFGQSAALLTEAFQENLMSTLPPFPPSPPTLPL